MVVQAKGDAEVVHCKAHNEEVQKIGTNTDSAKLTKMAQNEARDVHE